MRFTPIAFSAAALAALGLLVTARAGSTPASSPAAAPSAAAATPGPGSATANAPDFIIHRCGSAKCHGGEKPKEGLDLSSVAALKATAIGKDAEQAPLKRIVPGDPEASYLFLKITKFRRPDDKRLKWRNMPSGPKTLEDDEIALIEAWIKAGAKTE
jgi:hypothetical protein